jgi:hypothetical protein
MIATGTFFQHSAGGGEFGDDIAVEIMDVMQRAELRHAPRHLAERVVAY